MKRFKSLMEAKVEVDDISVGKKKKKPAGVTADEPLKGYAYNEDEQEVKQYVVRVQGKGAPGKDHMNVKTRAVSQKAALEKIRKQHPGNSYSIVKEDFETQLSLAIEEIELDEALSPKEKEKRLLMIKKAVQKLNRANIEKAKKMAMRDMKASGMFDDAIEEETELGEDLDDSAKKSIRDRIEKMQDEQDRIDVMVQQKQEEKRRIRQQQIDNNAKGIAIQKIDRLIDQLEDRHRRIQIEKELLRDDLSGN